MVGKLDFRWGDVDEEALPARQVIGPDEKGTKVFVEWYKNEDGSLMKTTQTVRVKRQAKKLRPAVAARRGIKKFGDAAGQHASDNLTMVTVDEELFIYRERAKTSSGATSSKQDGPLPPVSGDLASLGNASPLFCRICCKRGDHWTSTCPFKGDDAKSSYVCPSRRAGAVRSDGDKRRGSHENSIRVSNLSEDTREQDLQELFGLFGPISRIYVVFDRNTGFSRGFAFINFVSREDAVRAINKLDGYGYDNLILRVEWANS